MNWERLYASRTARLGASEIRKTLRAARMPDVISLAGEIPAPEAFPVQEFREAFDRVLERQGRQALQYSPAEGHRPLRELLAERLARTAGLRCSAARILITSGSQQALDLLARLFLDPGDRILVERPTYFAAIQAFGLFQAEYAFVPMDEHGMRTDLLDEALSRERVKFIYTIPNFQNPSGRTMSLERRRELVAVATRYGVPIVEDDPYGELRYEGEHLPSLAALDPSGEVIYLGTFSKILAPGPRVAWMVLPTPLFDLAVNARQTMDLNTGTTSQFAIHEVMRDGFVDDHLHGVRALYRERRDAMLAALAAHFPPGCRWSRPEGGIFVWVELPEAIDARELLLDALQEGVMFIPGQAFHPDGGGRNTMRLNFSHATPERLTEAIRRLGRAVERRLNSAQEGPQRAAGPVDET